MSLISLFDLNLEKIENLFRYAEFFKNKKTDSLFSNHIVAHLFFEPSTRTRMSFETATYRLGAKSVLLSGSHGTSLEKEESPLDTVKNVAAMNPDLLVVRCADTVDLAQCQKQLRVPIINAGWGKLGHPSQALLDILCLREKLNGISGQRILFVGDTRHSRVFASHQELSQILKYEIAVCGPEHLIFKGFQGVRFTSLDEGLRWCDSAYFLRYQKERFDTDDMLVGWDAYQLNEVSIKHMKSNAFFMHPGPVNWGREITESVLGDSRNLILNQVTWGVYLRMALIYATFRNEI